MKEVVSEPSVRATDAPATRDSRPSSEARAGGRRSPRLLLVGGGDLNEETRHALGAAGAEVHRMKKPTERDLGRALAEDDLDKVAIVARDDTFVLRIALMVRRVSSEMPLVVTVSDPTMADQLPKQVAHCRVTSLADIVAPSLAGPCIDPGLTAVRTDRDPPVGLRDDGDRVTEVELPPVKRRRVAALARAVFTPYDKSAGLLLYGVLGLVSVQLIETAVVMAALGQGFVDAFYGTAKTVVTVGPNDPVADGPGWLKLFTSATMLLTLGFVASFTAGLVERVVGRRLTGHIGRRAVPTSGHVVVAGLGPVGLRLCQLLRSCGLGVVAIEEDHDEEFVGLARELELPVVIGRAGDPHLLRRLRLERARALAAVTEDDLTNISVAVATRTINEDLRVVLRVGDGEIANETRSLLGLGAVRDVHRMAAGMIAAIALGSEPEMVVCVGDEGRLLHDDGQLEELPLDTLSQA